MQLARNVFPDRISREKTLIRKLKETKVALAIERKYSKDRILELYLNQIYLGNGAYGVETAAQRYFGKSARDLNLAEAATLAALPKAPSRYNPRRFPDRAVQRRNTVIELMRSDGLVSDADASLARAYPLALAGRSESGDVAPYFVEWIRQQLDARFGQRLYEQGLKIYTTLDLDLQSAAERALETQLRAIEAGKYGPVPPPDLRAVPGPGQRGRGADEPQLALPPGRVRRDGSAHRRRARHGGRPRLRRLQVQPRHAGAAAARLDLQADRLLHGDPGRRVAVVPRGRRAARRAPGGRRLLVAAELRPEVRRAHDAAPGASTSRATCPPSASACSSASRT